MTNKQRYALILVNVPFLVILHVAFLVHVVASFFFVWLFVYPDGRTIWQTIKHNYIGLVVRLFTDRDL